MNALRRLDSIAHLVALFLQNEAGIWGVWLHTPGQSEVLKLLHSCQDRNHCLRLPDKVRWASLLSCLSPREQAMMTQLLDQVAPARTLRFSITAHPEPYLLCRASQGDLLAQRALVELLRRQDLKPAYQLVRGWQVLTPLLQWLTAVGGSWVHAEAVVHASSRLGCGVQVAQGSSVAADVHLAGASKELPPSLLGQGVQVGARANLHAIVETGACIDPDTSVTVGTEGIPTLCGLPHVPAYHRVSRLAGRGNRVLLRAMSASTSDKETS